MSDQQNDFNLAEWITTNEAAEPASLRSRLAWDGQGWGDGAPTGVHPIYSVLHYEEERLM